jgi:hypothetical protein
MRTALGMTLVVLLAGCGDQAGRYQIVGNATGAVVWRLDTKTGEVSQCGWENKGKERRLVCYSPSLPDAPLKK